MAEWLDDIYFTTLKDSAENVGFRRWIQFNRGLNWDNYLEQISIDQQELLDDYEYYKQRKE